MQLTGLYLYPVKSLPGIALTEAYATAQGLSVTIADQQIRDRQWMIIKPNGQFVTQRQMPGMALINVALSNAGLVLSKAGLPDCIVPYTMPADASEGEAVVWQDTCNTCSESNDVNQWITQALGAKEPLRLVRMANHSLRPQSKPELLGKDTHTHFADAAPYLVANQASLNAVNSELKALGECAIDMRRFRPNLVIDGLPAFAEHNLNDTLIHYRDGSVLFRLCYPCQRCVITTIDPDTAIRHPRQQPFKLVTRLNPMPDNPKAPAFGVNATLVSDAVLLRV